MAETSLVELRALLVLLREFGVTEYSDLRGVTLRLGAGRPLEAAAAMGPHTPVAVSLREAAQAVSPALAEAVSRLPAGYERFFTGAGKASE